MNRITQIEITNFCNRKCSYCGQTNMTRTRGTITMSTMENCLAVLLRLGQTTVGLNHYGESLLHPMFPLFVRLLNDNGINPWLYTNGDLVAQRIKELAPLRFHHVVISGHMEKARRTATAELCRTHGINAQWQVTVADGALNLAGQVDVPTASVQAPMINPAKHCRFLAEQNPIVLYNGDLVPCCFDYDGKAVFGNINDPIDEVLKLAAKPSSICLQCPGHPANIIK